MSDSKSKTAPEAKHYLAYLIYGNKTLGLCADGTIELDGKACDSIDMIQEHITAMAEIQAAFGFGPLSLDNTLIGGQSQIFENPMDRDRLATTAMKELIQKPRTSMSMEADEGFPDIIAKRAYAIDDAMIAASKSE